MRIRLEAKFLLLFLIVLSLFFVGLWHKQSLDNEEIRAFVQDFNTHRRPLFKELNKLKGESFQALVADYTFWDEMVDFVGTGDLTFAASYLDTSLDTYKIDSVWVYNPGLSLVYSASKDREGKLKTGEELPFSADKLRTIFGGQRRFTHFFQDSPQGILEIRGGTIHPGFDVDRKTPARGYFLVARLWGRAYLNRLSKVLVNSSIELKTKELSEDKVTLEDPGGGVAYFTETLPGYDGKPVALLAVRTKLGFIGQFREITKNDFLVQIIIAFAVFAALYFAIRHWITEPVNILRKALDEGDASHLDPLSKKRHEFGRLALTLKKFFQQKEETLDIQQQLLQSQKMQAMGRLAGGVAHDFNNLLSVILGYLDLRLPTLKPEDPLRQDLEEVRIAAKRASGLTNHLLTFSRRQIFTVTAVNVNELVLNLNKMLRRLIGEDIELVVINSQEDVTTKADPHQLEQVIINLAVNARDAMPKGGKLLVETSRAKLGGEFFKGYFETKPGDYVLISIRDTGHGMTPEVKSHIFEPFFTTKEQGKGTGLGLATCYSIVKQMDGYILCDSEPGKGTTFRVYLPHIRKSSNVIFKKEDKPLLQLARGSETLLLAEDEPMLRNLSGKFLRDIGYTVLEASDGQEALRVAWDHRQKRIHLLLTDVVMPQMGGHELSKHMKGLHPDARVLFTSGYTDDAILHHGIQESKVDFIRKPFVPHALAQKVREVLDK